MSDGAPFDRPTWTPCEWPERRPDEQMVYHLGYLSSAGDGEPCRGCLIACEARVRSGEGNVGTLSLVATRRADLADDA